ncbi:MAG: hypothetical protein QOD72_1392 [Acidimicrobiaceae bacterium]|nr:hypothetical protein [Acidimicrobiaceae bacterium]
MARGKRDASKSKPTKKTNDENPLSEVIGLVKTYAKQEALAPLGNALRWLAYGALGAILLAIGFSLALLSLLRLLQTETGKAFDGNFTWVPYVITLAAALVVIGLAVWRIGKPTLDKEGSRR